jgi:HK97 family phage major capsid protein
MRLISLPDLPARAAFATSRRNTHDTPTMQDVVDAQEAMNSAFAGFRERIEGDIARVDNTLRELNTASAITERGGMGGGREAVDRATFAKFARGQIKAAMSTDSNPDGGYLVPSTIDSDIARLARDLSPMRRLARVIEIGGGQYSKLVSLNGTAAEWTSEHGARPETAGMNFSEISPPIHEIYANPKVTQTLLDDAQFNVTAELSAEIADAFSEKEGAAFIDGDGAGKPRGFLSHETVANSSWAWGKLGFVVTGDASGFDAAEATVSPADALINLVYSLKASYRRNASWLMSSATAGIVHKFKDPDGRFIWTDSIAQGQPPILLGYPVEIDENMPAVAGGNFPVAFGDFKRGYLIVDRIGIRLLRDPYTSKPYVNFYTTKRVGGTVVDFNAIKLLKVSA